MRVPTASTATAADTGGPSQPIRSRRDAIAARVTRITIGLLFVAWLIDYIDRLVITLALPSIGKSFGLDKTAEGLVLTVFFITYALFQLPGGVMADRIGARRTMTIALTAWSVFTGLTGLAVSYVMLLVVRLIFGATEGVFPAASMKAITERTRPAQRMTANGAMLASNPLGSALAPLVAAPALLAVGWQSAFFIVAGLGLVMAVVLWRLLPKPLPQDQRVDPGQAAAASRTTDTAATDHRPGSAVQARDLLRCGAMWRFALLFCGFDIVSWGLVSWAPSYLIDARGISLGTTGILTSIPWFVAAAVTIIGGLLFDRFFHRRPRRLIVPSMVVTGVFLYLMINASSVGQFVLFESLGMAAMWLSFMPIFGMPLRLLPAPIVGVGGGLVNFGGQCAGAITPFVMGWLADAFSFTAAFSFLLVGVVLAIVSAIWIPQTSAGFAKAVPVGIGVEPDVAPTHA